MSGEKKKRGRKVEEGQSKCNRLNLRVSDGELAIINTICVEDEESVSQVIRKALKQYDLLRKNRLRF